MNPISSVLVAPTRAEEGGTEAMNTIRLHVEAFAGTPIEDACRDLCALADRVGILCEVGFNGVKVWAYPGTDAAQLVEAWEAQMQRPEHLSRIANARPASVRGKEGEQR